MNEKQLQSKIVIEFSQKHPQLRGRLFATFQETINPAQGSNRLALGLVRGVSDLLFVNEVGQLTGIELKAPNTKHSTKHIIEQCNWLINVPKRGYFCTSVEMFWDIFNGMDGISPKLILEQCYAALKLRKKTIMF